MEEVISTTKDRMAKTISVLTKDLATLRAGRATPQALDRIMVDYYGTPTPINQVGNISAPEPRMLMIAPWDASMISLIEKAIQKSDLGINPMNDGKVIRLAFPEPTQERRKELVKQARKKGEEAKIAVRSIRRDANDRLKKEKKEGSITEDDLKDYENAVQKTTDSVIKEIDAIIEIGRASCRERV